MSWLLKELARPGPGNKIKLLLSKGFEVSGEETHKQEIIVLQSGMPIKSHREP